MKPRKYVEIANLVCLLKFDNENFMDKKIVTKGICYRCKQLVTKKSAKNHINKCFSLVKEHTAVNAFLLKVQWPHKNPIYWLYLAVPFKASLEDLDDFLRETWLECCSHLSQFTINNQRFSSYFESDSYSSIEQLSMSISSEKVLTLGLKFTHEYDFGSTTELLLEVVELIKIEATKEISIMIRNQEPEFKCSDCDEKAVMICPYEDNVVCESCSGDDESFLPLVNSPRTGVCGYVG
jgi:hypothetical protein